MSKKSVLPPFPNGWYNVSLSDDLKPGALKKMQFMGEEVVLFRTEKGKVHLIDAYCPHLGGHFGHGGEVIGEQIRCPFHGFCFDGEGVCVSTPYKEGKPPPTAIARTWPVRDINGFILAYHDADGHIPNWEIPVVGWDNWCPMIHTSLDIRSHPQETSENSVDLGHFDVVHGYHDVEVLSGLETEGPYLTAKYAMHRFANEWGQSKRTIRSEFKVHVHGLGYSFVEVYVPQFELHFRTFVLSTPVQEGRLTLTLAIRMKHVERPSKVHPLLALLPKALVHYILPRASFRAYVHDVKQDFEIWENKAYVSPPALAKGDGPVGRYRTWCKQFYPQKEQSYVESVAG